jgi:hypothetical protein
MADISEENHQLILRVAVVRVRKPIGKKVAVGAGPGESVNGLVLSLSPCRNFDKSSKLARSS